MPLSFMLRQQLDKGGIEIIHPGLCHQFLRAAGSQYLAVIQSCKPVKTRRFIHIGGGNQHTHAFTATAYTLDQFPKLTP